MASQLGIERTRNPPLHAETIRNSRFCLLPQSLEKMIDDEENTNTKFKTRRDTKVFEQFLKTKNKDESRDVSKIPPKELNTLLAEFVFCVKRNDGKEYEPTSIRGILASIQRHLRKKNYGYCIFKDIEFSTTVQALKAKGKQLKKIGLGNRPNEAVALSDEEVDVLYSKQLLGTSTPESVINTLWLNNCMFFGLRGCKENRDMRWGDLRLSTDENGNEFVENQKNGNQKRDRVTTQQTTNARKVECTRSQVVIGAQ